MEVLKTPLEGLLVIQPKIFRDDRGYFSEVFHEGRYAECGISQPFLQTNRSFSKAGVVRGLHFQNPQPQGKLVSVSSGRIFDVGVDVRPGSPTFGLWYGETLSGENARQLWVPPGFAHGFAALEDSVVTYLVTAYYDPGSEGTILWNDPDIGVDWQVADPILSVKDAAACRISAFKTHQLQM